jgi:DnaK suppressor protein
MAQSWDSTSNLAHKTFSPYVPRAGEAYMGRKGLAHFRKVLQAQKEELSQDIDRTVQEMHVDATVFADPNDRASQEADIGVEMRNRGREGNLIRKIEEAIARIDKDEYGYCVNCGVEIGLQRLEARPTATLCIDCKTMDEMRERRVAK